MLQHAEPFIIYIVRFCTLRSTFSPFSLQRHGSRVPTFPQPLRLTRIRSPLFLLSGTREREGRQDATDGPQLVDPISQFDCYLAIIHTQLDLQ